MDFAAALAAFDHLHGQGLAEDAKPLRARTSRPWTAFYGAVTVLAALLGVDPDDTDAVRAALVTAAH